MTETPLEGKKPGRPGLDAHDCIAIAGVLLFVGGVFWIYRPAALIALGGLLVFYAWISSKPPQGT